MPQPRKRRRKSLLATVVFLVPIGVFVVYSSLQVSDYECEVCITFRGNDGCRTVMGKTREEALRGATDNACALLASGVTDTLRCARTVPRKSECRRVSGG